MNCNNNKNHSPINFERWFIEIFIFKVLPVRIWSFGQVLVHDLFPEKHVNIHFSKHQLRDILEHRKSLQIRLHYPSSGQTSDILDSFEIHLESLNNSVALKIRIFHHIRPFVLHNNVNILKVSVNIQTNISDLVFPRSTK